MGKPRNGGEDAGESTLCTVGMRPSHLVALKQVCAGLGLEVKVLPPSTPIEAMAECSLRGSDSVILDLATLGPDDAQRLVDATPSDPESFFLVVGETEEPSAFSSRFSAAYPLWKELQAAKRRDGKRMSAGGRVVEAERLQKLVNYLPLIRTMDEPVNQVLLAQLFDLSLSKAREVPGGLPLLQRIALRLLPEVGSVLHFRRWLDLPLDDFAGRTARDLLHAGDGEVIAQLLEDAALGQPG